MSSPPRVRPEDLDEALAARLPALMREAVAEACRADMPFGCVLADAATGESLGSAANSAASDATGHAEINALRLMAARKIEASRVVLVSTAEPCPMCASASWWAGVRGVVYGTSTADLVRFGWRQIDLPAADLLAKARPAATLFLSGGYLSDETDPLYSGGPKPGG